MRPARKKAANFWAQQATQMNGKPIRSPPACSIAAKLLLRRAVVPTTSPWPRPEISGTADAESPPDAAPPRSSVGTNNKNDTNKLETVKSGEAKNHPTQSPPPTPLVTTTRPHRPVDQ